MDIGELDGWVAESRDSPTSLISKMFFNVFSKDLMKQ